MKGSTRSPILAAAAGMMAFVLVLSGCAGVSGTLPPAQSPSPAPRAKFAYVANDSSGSISGYSVDATTGQLSALAGFPVPAGLNPNFIIHDPARRFLIVADIAASQLRVYSIDATSGMLAQVPPSPYATAKEPRALAIDPTGKFVYVANQGENSVAAFALSSGGVLTAVPGSPFPTGGTQFFGSSIVVHPSGRSLYVMDLNTVYAFAINTGNGALSLTNNAPGPATGDGLALDPTGTRLFAVGSSTNSILTYTIDPVTGGIAPSVAWPLVRQDGAYTITLDPSGHFAYTVEAGQTLVTYSVQNGVLTGLNQYPGALGSQQITIDPSDSFLYVPQTGNQNNVSGYRIGASGTLTAVPGSPTASGQWPFSIDIISQ